MAKRSGGKRVRPQPAKVEGSRVGSVVLRALVIIAAGFAIYWPALRGDWLWDDDILISQNAMVQSPDGLWKIWFQPGSMIDYFPLTVTVEWIEWHLFGNNTLGYHLVCLTLHLIGALLVWRLLGKFGLRWAWMGGLLFAVHPIAVESVAWIAELKNTLSLPPFLLAMLFWIDFDERRQTRDNMLALGFFLAAMLCKTTMVMFPVVILLYAWWKRDRINWRDLETAAPFFVVSFVLGLVTVFFVQHSNTFHQGVPFGGPLSRLACAGLSIAFYFSKCVLPVGLMPIYPRWNVDPPSLVQFLPCLVLAATLFLLWKKRNEWGRHALLGLGFFLILLLPFCGFVTGSYMRFSWVMDHIVYLPLIGIIGLAVAGIESLNNRLPIHLRYGSIALAIIVLIAAVSSHSYAGIYTSRTTYWTFALQQNPHAWLAHNNLANELEKSKRHSEGLVHFTLALQDKPDYVEALFNRGLARMILDDPAGSMADLNQAIALEPDASPAYFGRAVLLLSQGDATDALSDLQQYGQRVPHDPQADYAQLWIWIIRNQQGQKAQADQELSAALSQKWNAAPDAWASQNARILLGRISESDYLAAAVVSNDPDKDQGQHCEAWFYLGEKRLFAGDKIGASAAFRACLATGQIEFFEYMLAKAQLQADKLHSPEQILSPTR
jgi:lipoprotein NlpI